MMAKITCNGPNKNTLFNILPNKTKTHSLIYFQKKQKSEESKEGEQSKWLLTFCFFFVFVFVFFLCCIRFVI